MFLCVSVMVVLVLSPIWLLPILVSMRRESKRINNSRREYSRSRRHTASLGGQGVEFSSYYKPGTFGLHSDAVQALKQAGLYHEREDWERVLIDGSPHTY